MEKLEFKKEEGILRTLSAADARLSLLIAAVGDYSLELKTDYFASLVKSIISQQLGVGAARTIWLRTMERCKDVCPEVIINLPDETFKSAGVSRSKILYIKDLAEKVGAGAINFHENLRQKMGALSKRGFALSVGNH